MKYFVSLAAFLLLASPVAAMAQGLVPQCGASCDWCHFMELVNNLVEWLIVMLSIVAVIGLVIAGFRLVTSGGNTSAWEGAKSMFTSVVVGIIIVLAAWLMVDTVLRMLTGSGINGWLPDDCGGALNAAPGDDEDGGGGIEVGSRDCPTCAQIEGVSCKNANSCQVTETYASRLSGLSSADIEITEAWPPTRTHQAACHQNGTCTDVVFADRNFTTERVREFQELAERNGFRAVYEPGAGGSCAGVNDCLPHSTTRSTADHFSLYLD